MQSTKHHVTGFRRRDRRRDRFKVSHFAHEDHVRVHSQSTSQSFREAWNVNADLTLINRGMFMLVIVLDRVFQSDDVMIHVMVHPVDHRRETGRLTGTCRTCHEEQTTRSLNQILTDRR